MSSRALEAIEGCGGVIDLRWPATIRGGGVSKLIQSTLVLKRLIRVQSIVRLTWIDALSEALLDGERADGRVLRGTDIPLQW